MNKNLENAQNKFIESIGRITDAFGLNSFVAKLYAFLYLSNKPLSLDEITEALGASKSNVSINIRELEKMDAVKKIWIKGSRKDYYEAELDIKKLLLTKIRSAAQKRLTDVYNVVEDLNQTISLADGQLTEEEKKIAACYRERLKRIGELKEIASHALILAEKLL